MKRRDRNVVELQVSRTKKRRSGKAHFGKCMRSRFSPSLLPWLKVVMLFLIVIAVVTFRETRVLMRITVFGATGCEVVNVIDGDTVTAYCPGRGFERTRLVGFDTPEVFSPQCVSESWAGARATLALRRLIWSAKKVKLICQGTDRYGRRLARLFVDGSNVSRMMIDAGHARSYGGGQRAGWC